MSNRPPPLTEAQQTIVALGTAKEFQKLQDFVLASTEPSESMVAAVWSLLNDQMIRGAYLVAKLLHLRGVTNPVLSFALFFGGIDLKNQTDIDDGRRLLRQQFDKHPPEVCAAIYSALEPLIIQQISVALGQGDFAPHVLHLLDLLKQVVPEFRDRFDLDAPARPLDLADLRHGGRAKARLLTLTGRPAGAPRPPRRALVAFRELVFPHFHNSRLLEQGPTMVAAFNGYGWRAHFHGMRFNKHEDEDVSAIVAACLAQRPDVLVIDAVIFNFPKPLAAMADLRRQLPAMKMVGVYFDAWSVGVPHLIGAAAQLDLIWTVSPDFAPWALPEFAGKVIHMPLPRGGDYGGPILPLQPKLSFTGGVAAYNWHRALWIAAMRKEGLPIETHLNAFIDDKVSALESYLAYMRRIADSRCSINFSMRQNMTTFSVTARTFETLAAGSLLVQERAPETDCFLIEGEHYLPFSNFAELRAVVQFIAARTDEAEQIRRDGNAFARARYGDDKLVGYLEQALFGEAG